MMNSIVILSCSISMQGIEPYSCDFVKTKNRFNIKLYVDIYRLLSLKPGMIIVTT